jgi:Mg-chelatase subunit ChlD
MVLDAALALVVDRSGSMYSIANDVRGSVKQFIGDQKKMEGKASLRVAQFDHTYEVIHDVNDIAEVDENAFADAYKPRGSTALLDAIGRTIFDMKEKLAKIPQEEKPKRVVIAVITDGLENSSREYRLEQIKNMVKENEALGWDFLFMGASLDAIDVAKSMGFAENKATAYDTSNISSCMGNLSAKFSQARVNEEIKFTQEEREAFMQTPQTPPQTTAQTTPGAA